MRQQVFPDVEGQPGVAQIHDTDSGKAGTDQFPRITEQIHNLSVNRGVQCRFVQVSIHFGNRSRSLACLGCGGRLVFRSGAGQGHVVGCPGGFSRF